MLTLYSLHGKLHALPGKLNALHGKLDLLYSFGKQCPSPLLFRHTVPLSPPL